MTVVNAYTRSDYTVVSARKGGSKFNDIHRMSRYGREEKLYYLKLILDSPIGYVVADREGTPKTKYHPVKGMIRDGLISRGRMAYSQGFGGKYNLNLTILKLTDKGREFLKKNGKSTGQVFGPDC